MPASRARRLWIARLNRRDGALALDEFEADVMEALATAPSVTRYRRTWHVTRPERRMGYIAAKLGFETSAHARTVRFDPVSRDFVTEQRVSDIGSFSHFMIDPGSQLLAFEERMPDIRRQSFVGAMAQLLERADRPFEIDLVPSEESFSAFLSQVAVVTRFHARVVRPNPTYRSRAERARQLIEPTNASETDIDSRVAKNREDGLIIQDTVLEDVAEHVFATNGRIRMTGRSQRGGRRFYDSARQLATGEIEVDPDDDSDTVFTRIAEFMTDFRERWSE